MPDATAMHKASGGSHQKKRKVFVPWKAGKNCVYCRRDLGSKALWCSPFLFFFCVFEFLLASPRAAAASRYVACRKF